MKAFSWLASTKSAPKVTRPDELITAYDERGRELKVRRGDWVAKVLMPAIEKAWSDPKELAAQILQALRDDFVAQVADASSRLVELDHESVDSLVISAVVQMELGDLDGGERTLQRSMSKHGPTGLVLTNMAKLLERRGRITESRAALRQSLQLDPNQDNALLWWAALAREQHGDAAYTAALDEIAAVAGAWRPQLWLARERLKHGDRSGALALYERALARADLSSDALMMVTGDLGNAGALDDLVRLGAPRYKPEVHGPAAGMNLVQAYKQLGRYDEAKSLLRAMQAMPWPPFAASLAALESEIASASLPAVAAATPQLGGIAFGQPIWTRGLFEPDWLFEQSGDDAPLVALFTFADETLEGASNQVRKADYMGRLTRALPLYLAETLMLHYETRARATLYVARGQGPAIFGRPLSREILEGTLASTSGRRIAVSGTLVKTGVRLELWEVGIEKPSTVIAIEASLSDLGSLTERVHGALLHALNEQPVLHQKQLPSVYRDPPPRSLAGYVTALEQFFSRSWLRTSSWE